MALQQVEQVGDIYITCARCAAARGGCAEAVTLTLALALALTKTLALALTLILTLALTLKP